MYMSGPPSQFGALRKRMHYSRSGGSYRRGKTSSHFFMGDAAPPFTAPPGYKWEYSVDGLSGLGRFKLKKVFKSVINVAKKVVKVAKKVVKSKIGKLFVAAVAIYFAAPWFLTLVKTVGMTAAKALLQQHAPPGESAEEAAARAETETSTGQMPDWIAGPAQALIQSRIQGEAQAKAAQTANQAAIALQRQQEQAAANEAARADTEISPQARYATTTTGETPSWIIPAAIGGAALLLMTTLS
jgi:hypothetical protein